MNIAELAKSYEQLVDQCGWDVIEIVIYDRHPEVAEELVEYMQNQS